MRTRWPWCLPWVFTCPRPALSSCSPTTSLRLSQEPVERHQLRAIWRKSRRVRRSGKCGPRPCAGLGSVGPRGAATGRLAAPGGECQSSRGPKHVVGAAPAGARGTDPAVDTHSITRPLPSAAGGLLIMRTATTPAVPSPLRVWVMIPGSQTEPLQAKVLAVSKAMPETSLSAHRKSMGITQHVIFSSFILL